MQGLPGTPAHELERAFAGQPPRAARKAAGGPPRVDSCIGIDPGPTTGMCFLDYCEGRLVGRTVLQVHGATAVHVLEAMLAAYYGPPVPGSGRPPVGRRDGAVERFVTGQGAGSRGKPADVTRQLEMELAETLEGWGYPVKIRPAAMVKPWASNKRVAAALGLKESQLTDSLRHGWDGARHCVFGAREAGIIADPLRRVNY